jgi:Flp pilus assembly protein TadG
VVSIRRLTDLRRDACGAVSAFIALGMVVFLGSAAIAIDLGHLMNVRTESQRVADAAALAGASVFATGASVTSLVATAEQRAIDVAGRNLVNQGSVILPVADIQVDIPNERVRVTVRHSTSNGNPIPTIFARVLGINDVDVVTTAVAEAFPAAGARCILPFMLPDKYSERGGDPNRYGAPPDYYEAYDASLSPPSPTSTGYTDADIGTQLVIKPSQGNTPAQPNPSWYYPLAVAANGGANYRAWIAGCVDPSVVYAIGDNIDVEPGAMIGPTRQGVDALVGLAPTHQWSVANNCVIDSAGSPNICVSSPRLRPVPMMAPPDAPGNGRKTVPIMNWAGVFVEGMRGNDVVVRFAGYSGFAAVTNTSGNNGSLPKVIRLIE